MVFSAHDRNLIRRANPRYAWMCSCSEIPDWQALLPIEPPHFSTCLPTDHWSALRVLDIFQIHLQGLHHWSIFEVVRAAASEQPALEPELGFSRLRLSPRYCYPLPRLHQHNNSSVSTSHNASRQASLPDTSSSCVYNCQSVQIPHIFPLPNTRHLCKLTIGSRKSNDTYRQGSQAWRIRFAGRSPDIEFAALTLSMKCAKRCRSLIYHFGELEWA
jgi:hypothetical protein